VRTTTTAGEASSRSEAATTTTETLLSHHAEEDLRVNASHTSTHATATEHVVRVHKVITIIVGSALPKESSQ
jgi:hypothetical protein